VLDDKEVRLRRSVAFALTAFLCQGGSARAGPASAAAGDPEPAFRLFSAPPRGLLALAGNSRTAAPLQAIRLPLPFGENGAVLSREKPKKHFWVASAEVLGLEVLTWAFGRYYLDAPYSRISLDVWKTNLRTGFDFDQGDDFSTNQVEHPYHGSFYYNAARTNGFDLWESALFAAAGSVLWEYFGENQLPSTNDLINTSLGGVSQGEAAYRLSTMLLDNTASGSSRLWREIGGFLLNPIGGLNRAFRGQMTKDFPNPEDRLPGSFSVELYAGYQHLGDGTAKAVPYPRQALFGLLIRYGDPFSGPNRKPFDFFETELELAHRSNAPISRLNQRGQLASWAVSSSPSAEHRVAAFLGYEYNNDQSQIYSSMAFTANLLSRFPMAGEAEVRTELAAVGLPLAALQVDFEDVDIAQVDRPYDYTLGGGVQVAARLYRRRMDLLSISYQAVWLHSVSGIAKHSAAQSLRLEGRLPLDGALTAGAAWNFNRRITSYAEQPTARVEGSQWRVFGVLLLQ
jgi:Domain of unknown function (DUF3943)